MSLRRLQDLLRPSLPEGDVIDRGTVTRLGGASPEPVPDVLAAPRGKGDEDRAVEADGQSLGHGVGPFPSGPGTVGLLVILGQDHDRTGLVHTPEHLDQEIGPARVARPPDRRQSHGIQGRRIRGTLHEVDAAIVSGPVDRIGERPPTARDRRLAAVAVPQRDADRPLACVLLGECPGLVLLAPADPESVQRAFGDAEGVAQLGELPVRNRPREAVMERFEIEVLGLRGPVGGNLRATALVSRFPVAGPGRVFRRPEPDESRDFVAPSPAEDQPVIAVAAFVVAAADGRLGRSRRTPWSFPRVGLDSGLPVSWTRVIGVLTISVV